MAARTGCFDRLLSADTQILSYNLLGVNPAHFLKDALCITAHNVLFLFLGRIVRHYVTHLSLLLQNHKDYQYDKD